MRWPLMVTALLLGCEREPRAVDDKGPPGPVQARDAATAPTPTPDANVAALLDALEPKQAPPPAIVRRKPPQGDCRTAYAPRPGRDPNPMCKVDGGTFVMGGRERVTVTGFFIDQFKVTAQQAALFLNAHGNVCGTTVAGATSECVPVGNAKNLSIQGKQGRFEVIAGGAERPVAFTIAGARRYCDWVGKLVPSEAQWEYAARHDPRTGRDRVYPWGDVFDPNRFARLEVNQPEQIIAVVGSFDGPRNNGASPWGLYDMFGTFGDIVSQCESPTEPCDSSCRCPHVDRGTGWAKLTEEKTPPWDVLAALRCARPL